MARNDREEVFTDEEINDIFVKTSDCSETLRMFVSNKGRTQATLNRTPYNGRNDIKLLHILAQAVHCPINREDVISFLSIVKDSKFYKEGLGLTLGAYNPADDELNELCKILKECVTLIDLMCTKLPSTIEETATFGLIALLRTKIQNLLPDIGENMRDDMCITSEILSRLQGDIMKKLLFRDKSAKTNSHFENQLPPDDFRKIPILPTEKDIFMSRVFLRPNKSKGKYENLQHYLDVQFRLYREDCISPLREGIVEYVRECSAGRSVGRLQDGRLYKDVVASNPEYTLEGLSVTITIDMHHASRINWRTSHRLIYGSLVCLSPDQFQTMFFAVIVESNRPRLMSNGSFKVVFAIGTKDARCPLDSKLTMVESTAYYESYRHVLSSLQKIKDGDLPFEKYIVYCKKTVDQPKYMLGSQSVLCDLQPIVENHAICQQETRMEQNKVRNVNVFSPVPEWPSPDELHLDISQFEAFHSALTEEFVLIQGPPGTGKTYVGLQIAKTLLHNKSIWITRTRCIDVDDDLGSKTEEKCPMLIVCFTNHALDQFMEGIINFHDKHNSLAWKNEIVRVGGRGESEMVEEFSLKNRRQKCCYFVNKGVYMREIDKNRCEIAKIQWCLNKTKTVILSPSLLKDVIDEKHYSRICRTPSKKGKKKNEEEMIAQWLAATEQDWLTRATRCYSKGIKPWTCTEKERDHNRDTVDVETDAERAEYDRRIEEDEDVFEFQDTIGFDVEKVLDTFLSAYEEEGIDERLLSLIESEANNIMWQLSSTDRMTDEEVNNQRGNIQSLPHEDRWSLYRYWLNKYRVQQNLKLEQLREYRKSIYKDYEREKQENDARILKEATVIGMTTTGAARYQDVLREIGPRIIIVEEAAEVLEAHIVATLSSKCEHLILIGDHKQLQPKPSVYELAIRYNIGISMFERMINNELSYHCLQRQHRMRPEISTLVRHIYPVLIDNENVQEYGHVKGVKKDVYFISHKQPEQFREDIRSYSNAHEARYIMRLCRYLMFQGYDAKQITVLAAYNGQMFTIRDLMPKSEFNGVRVCVVDNYQGEENDIVLLSLVRSNTTERIGFLKRENRICVALSRAKIGLYVIGNFGILGKGSRMWRKIMNVIREMQGISDALPLCCENHPKKIIMAKTPEDFDQAPQGGCIMNCDFRLPCGHSCRLKCHPTDTEHQKYECLKTCSKVCRSAHTCQRKCHYGKECMCCVIMEKTLRCKHKLQMECWEDPEEKKCRILVQRTLEKCGHEAEMECFTDPKEFKCKTTVNKTLTCEHKADILCSIDPRGYKCKELVARNKSCGHTYELECYKSNMLFYRLRKCNKLTEKTFISCGHTLTIECYVNLNNLRCQTNVNKLLDCGHEINVKCYMEKYAKCTHKCLKVCDNNHVCQALCHYGRPCECKIKIQKTIPMCGHEQTMFCYSDPSFEKCETRIRKQLPNCEHTLVMECGADAAMVECEQIVSKFVPSCGHMNNMFCHSEPSDFSECDTLVNKELKCGHLKQMKCCDGVSVAKCEQRVSKTFSGCNHKAEMTCYDKNFRAIKCEAIVKKVLPNCGHTQDVPCFTAVSTMTCKELITITLPCGHKCEVECSVYQDNYKSNYWRIRKQLFPDCHQTISKTLPCKHEISVECCSRNDVNVVCNAECGVTLSCGHSCKGRCNDCFLSFSHLPCKNSCRKKLICGHDCPSLTCGSCRPCQQICLSYCPHTACEHICGTPCKPCNEPCSWVCPHKRCSKTCDEPCDRSRCQKRCTKTLECLHQCLGFCGEPCPDICSECSPSEFKKLMIDSNPCDDKGMLVILQECGHSFLAENIDQSVEDSIKSNIVRCPTCSSIIRWHPRYGHILKTKRKIQNQIKSKISAVKHKEKSTNFPIVRRNFESVINFCRECKTFLCLLEISFSDNMERIVQEYTKITNLASNLLTYLEELQPLNLCEQTLHDIFNKTYEMAARWMMFIVQDSLNEEENSIDYEDYEVLPVSYEQNQKYLIKKGIAKDAMDILEHSAEFTLEILCRIQETLGSHFDDVEQMTLATNYPVFEGVINVHLEDWRLCSRGHIQPCSGHRDCFQCEIGREPDLEIFMKNKETRTPRGGQRGRGQQRGQRERGQQRGGQRGCRQGGTQRGGRMETGFQGNDHSAQFQRLAEQRDSRPWHRGGRHRGRGRQGRSFGRGQRRYDSQVVNWGEEHDNDDPPNRSQRRGRKRGRILWSITSI